MANFVRFHRYLGDTVTVSADNPLINDELNESTVESITVVGDPWVFFDSPCYGGDFVIYEKGKNEPFPPALEGGIIKSVRRIKGGIDNSQVTLYSYPFFEGTGKSFPSKTPQLEGTYFSLKVAEGAVVFFDDENYTGGKRILLNGDEVENFTAVKLTSIGKSMKIARDIGRQ